MLGGKIGHRLIARVGHIRAYATCAGIAVLAVLVRHYFNTRHNSHKYAWTLPVAALSMVCLAYVTGPKPPSTAPETANVIQYQPLPETAVGGIKAADAPPPAGSRHIYGCCGGC